VRGLATIALHCGKLCGEIEQGDMFLALAV
jgi:hypothetical protein